MSAFFWFGEEAMNCFAFSPFHRPKKKKIVVSSVGIMRGYGPQEDEGTQGRQLIRVTDLWHYVLIDPESFMFKHFRNKKFEFLCIKNHS